MKVSFWLELGDQAVTFLDRLEAVKSALQATDAEVLAPVSVGGMSWNLSRTGTRFYAYRLTAGDVVLLLSRRSGGDQAIPAARLEIGSLSSQTDLLATLLRVRVLFSDIEARIKREQVSELHLAVDFIGVDLQGLGLDNMNRWISKARHFVPYYEHWRLTGCALGRGDMLCRCYDKVLELKEAHHKQPVFAQLWGVVNFDDLPVTRVEFQLRRPVLKEFKGLDNDDGFAKAGTDHLLQALASVWKYCTEKWTRLSEKDVDRSNKHQGRAQIAEFWRNVQGVAWIDLFSVERCRPDSFKDEVRLRQQAVGLLMSVAAFYVDDIYDFPRILDTILKLVNEDIQSFQRDEFEFIKRMKIKRNAAILEL